MNRMNQPMRATDPEVGGIVHLEHVNFETPDHDMATVFYMNGIGLTRDPYARIDETNMGVNVGLQQFHLPRRGDRTPPFPGVVALVVPDLAGVRNRLGLLHKAGRFAGTPYAYSEGKDTAEIVTPFGYRLRLHAADTIPFLRPLGLAYVEIPVPPARLDAVAGFYRKVMRAPVETRTVAGERTAVVAMGPHQSTRFVARDLDSHDTHSTHIAYYIANYNEVRQTLARLGAPMTAGDNELFFLKAVVDPDSGEPLLPLHNEIRSLYHPDFMRLLVNRWPIGSEPFRPQSQAMLALAAEIGFVPDTR